MRRSQSFRPAVEALEERAVPALVAVPQIVELNIGHAVIADAVFAGLPAAVRGFLVAIERGRRSDPTKGEGER